MSSNLASPMPIGVLLLFLLASLCFLCIAEVYGQSDLASLFPSTSFGESYTTIWGQPVVSQEGFVELKLDTNSGSGFKSIHSYYHAFFSAMIKLPPNYTAGVVTAFYASNYDDFPETHDEADFEFLGVVPGSPYVLQTNVYGDGSVNIGREERVNLWFDPAADFHRYSILWNSFQLVFFVDNIPVRQMKRSDQLGQQYPSKAMKSYATIWDGSDWATNGGRSPVNYDYSPFVSRFTDFKLQACEQDTYCADEESKILNFQDLNQQQQNDLAWVRSNQMTYSYCDDRQRYSAPPPECSSTSTMKSTTFRTRKYMRTYHRSIKRQVPR